MNSVVETAFDVIRIAELCRNTPPNENHQALLTALNHDAGVAQFALAKIGKEWYRLGGVTNAFTHRVSDNFMQWAEAAFADAGEDMEAFIAKHGESAYQITRFDGRTLYFTAFIGPNPADFVQLEVDMLQEVIDRPLIDAASPPMDLGELIDPLDYSPSAGESLGAARYVLKRLTHMGDFINALDRQAFHVTRVHRFIQEWRQSSAFNEPFCRHWIFKLTESIGQLGESQLSATPISLCSASLPKLDDAPQLNPIDLANALRRFDRRVGYPFAWYFFMVRQKAVTPIVAKAVVQHIQQDFRYLPERDMVLLQQWLRDPYYL